MRERRKRGRLLLPLVLAAVCAALGIWLWAGSGSGKVVNILLVGQDARPGEEVARSDAMIVCTFNTQKKTVTFTSFQRDMYVTIPGYWQDKLNHSFAYGAYYGDGGVADAFGLLNQTLEYNFGVEVDGNVEVNFDSFIAVIDRVGGVDIELTDEEAEWLAQDGYELTGGVNRLSGEEALAYARIRYLDSDFGRNARQRKVLSALVERVKGLDLFRQIGLVRALLPMVWTDLDEGEIMGYALEILPMLPGMEIRTQQIPAEGTYRDGEADGMSVQIVTDMDANRAILEEIMGGD